MIKLDLKRAVNFGRNEVDFLLYVNVNHKVAKNNLKKQYANTQISISDIIVVRSALLLLLHLGKQVLSIMHVAGKESEGSQSVKRAYNGKPVCGKSIEMMGNFSLMH